MTHRVIPSPDFTSLLPCFSSLLVRVLSGILSRLNARFPGSSVLSVRLFSLVGNRGDVDSARFRTHTHTCVRKGWRSPRRISGAILPHLANRSRRCLRAFSTDSNQSSCLLSHPRGDGDNLIKCPSLILSHPEPSANFLQRLSVEQKLYWNYVISSKLHPANSRIAT